MAITVTSVTPNTGHSGGSVLVEIVGTGFVPPALAPAGVPLPYVVPPTMAVQFGTAANGYLAAANVQVYSSTFIQCLAPAGILDVNGNLIAPVDIVAQSLDANGNVTGSGTLAAAFTHVRPDVGVEGDLARTLRALIRMLKLNVLQNVVFSTHTDFDGTTGDILNIATVQSVPALILSNFEIPDDRIFAVNEPEDFPAEANRFVRRRKPVVVDLHAVLVGVTDNPITLLNLMQITRTSFLKNPYLIVPASSDGSVAGTVKYELDWSFGGPVNVTHTQDNSNVESFAGTIVVRGVRLEDMPGAPKATTGTMPGQYAHEANVDHGYVVTDPTPVLSVDAPIVPNIQEVDNLPGT